MKKWIFWTLLVIFLVPAGFWGHGLIMAAMDAKDKKGPAPDIAPEGEGYKVKVQKVIHVIERNGYDYYFRNFTKVTEHKDKMTDEIGF